MYHINQFQQLSLLAVTSKKRLNKSFPFQKLEIEYTRECLVHC